jgi:hypothetical protein
VGRGGVSSQLILITQPLAVQQALGVGGEEGGRGEEAGEKQIRAPSNPYSSFSSSSYPLYIRRGFDKKFCLQQCRTLTVGTYTRTSVFKDNKSLRNSCEIKVFLNFFLLVDGRIRIRIRTLYYGSGSGRSKNICTRDTAVSGTLQVE